jgi:serpin B
LFRGRPAGNQVFSPGSISLALAMTWAGARGETAAQLAQPFGFDDSTHAGAAGLLNAYNQEGSPLAVANRLFGEESFDLRAEFLALAQARYAAPFEGVDFRQDADGAREHINSGWRAAPTTASRDLLPPGTVDDDHAPRAGERGVLPGPLGGALRACGHAPRGLPDHRDHEVRVPMMNHRLHVRSATVAGARVLELPYEGDRFAMVFVLPEARHGLAALEGGLDAAQWESSWGACRRVRPWWPSRASR